MVVQLARSLDVAQVVEASWTNLTSGLALLVALVTLVLSRRDVEAARRSALEADARAERATLAAERSARAHVELLNRLPGPSVEWRVSYLSGNKYELRNVGRSTALEVELKPMQSVVIDEETNGIPGTWPPGLVVHLYEQRLLCSPRPTVEITWKEDATGERLQSSFPLDH